MKFFHKQGGSTGFHISYSEIVILPKFVENLNKDFIKAVRGGGVTVFWKYFIKFRYFLKDGFPKTIKLTNPFLGFLQWSRPSGFETQVCQKNLQTHGIGVSPDMGLGAKFCKSLAQTRAVVVVARPSCPLSSDVPTTVRRQSTTDNHDQQLQSRGKITINNPEP